MATVVIPLAIGVATSLAAQALSPSQNIDTGGLGDLSVPRSSYGVIIPQCWGTLKLAGNLIWATRLREVSESRSQGGKGGRSTVTERSYFANFAVMFAYQPHRGAEALNEISLNGTVVYAPNSDDPETRAASEEFARNHLRFYFGTPDQPVDPLIANAEPIQTFDFGLPHDPQGREDFLNNAGLGHIDNVTTAYRYKVYAVFENLPLADYGNQIPSVRAKIVFSSDCRVAQIVADLCNQAGQINYEVGQIHDIKVPAFYIDSQSSAKQAIQILQQVFFFDVVKTGKTLNFIAQSAPREVLPIPFDDLAAHQVGQATPEPFELPRPDLEQLPRSVELNFIDLENDYEVGNVQSRSQVEGSQREETFTFPIALNSAQAQQICDALLHRFYLEAIRPSFALLPKYSFLQNADRFSTIIYGETYTFQITGINMGANRLLQLETKLFEPANIENITTEQVISDGGLSVPIASEIITQGNTNLEIMDINLIADSHSDNGLYFSAYGGVNWRECSIYVSNDDSSYYFAGNLTAPGTIGSLAADFAQDDTTLLVSLAAGEFESISAADFAGCINKILVGNEIIQAQNVALEGDNFRLSNLKRGLRGTENFTIHPLGERVILLTGSAAKIIRIDGTAEDIGQIRYFKAPSPGQTLDQAPTTELLIEGNSLRPYAPVNPVATVDAVGNITINWQRRDRHAGNATTYDNLPLSEISEQWEIEVLEGLIVKRVLTSGMSEVSYSVANQQSDFGSPQSSVNVRIFQISATVGRGYPLQVDLAPTLQEAAPEITSFNPVSGGQAATITVLGSGLSGVTEVNINGVAQDNLVVVSDNELSFVVAPGTTSGVITVTSPGGLASSNQAFVFASNTAIPIFNNVVVVDFSRDIQDSDFGALLLVDTNQSDVVLTFDETLLTNPENFGFVVQKDSDLNKVIFADNGSNIVASQDLELIDLYQSKRFYYAGANSWRGL